ncbi:MAG: LacI family transcriptional regulator [Hyphomonadaceae bacterium]|nr:MAG: LacI family transcriptional regulator [Hyphomonadaceae bacterium]KAF0183477.1 MAG: LacI family transcriptional regulator [Hyphomonadaceae bacterium]
MAGRAQQSTATISDVATLAQVSIKTVSRVMNDEPNVRAQTRDRVKEAAKSLNYNPSMLARSLAGGKSYLIGLIYDNINSTYAHDLQTGMIARCRLSKYHLMCEPQTSENPDLIQAISNLLATIRLDGIAISPPFCDMPQILDIIEATGMSYVRISPSKDLGRAACVRMDEFDAAYNLTKHLIERGHKEIGFIRGHPQHGGSHLRFEGFCKALKDYNIDANQNWISQGYFYFESGREAARQIFEHSKRPSAIFAANDYMAFGLMAYLHDMGLKVPEDVSIVGFDDVPGCQLVWPHLTTIHQPVTDMGYAAAEILLNNGPKERVLPYRMIERGSVLKKE